MTALSQIVKEALAQLAVITAFGQIAISAWGQFAKINVRVTIMSVYEDKAKDTYGCGSGSIYGCMCIRKGVQMCVRVFVHL